LIALPIVTDEGLRLTLGEVARVEIADGPSMIRSENGRLSAFVYVDVRGRDLASVVGDLQRGAAQMELPAGVSVAYSGQFEYLERAANV
jgi:Cu(I)/Ag(I) efflux system membrane protein CusA/SilA